MIKKHVEFSKVGAIIFKEVAKNHAALTDSLKTPAGTQNFLTDPELYALCKRWGAEALQARRKFIGLLPEVNARRLYERRNFRSIYHFAAALGGVGKRLVDEVLCLEKRFAEMPTLHSALIKGEIGLSKLARIASIVTVENEAEICEKIRTLSRRAVDVFVKEMGGICSAEENRGENLFENYFNNFDSVESHQATGDQNHATFIKQKNTCVESYVSQQKTQASNESENQNGSQKPQSDQKTLSGQNVRSYRSARSDRPSDSVPGQNFDFEILNALSPEVKAKLKELIDKEIDINQIILTALTTREAEIAEQKDKITEKEIKNGNLPAKSRHIPSKIIKILKAEFGSKCAYPNCQKPAEQIHHEKPFVFYQDHNPHDLKPLCRGHHELKHVVNLNMRI